MPQMTTLDRIRAALPRLSESEVDAVFDLIREDRALDDAEREAWLIDTVRLDARLAEKHRPLLSEGWFPSREAAEARIAWLIGPHTRYTVEEPTRTTTQLVARAVARGAR